MALRFVVNLDPNLRPLIEREARAHGRTVPKQIERVMWTWLNQKAIARSKDQMSNYADRLAKPMKESRDDLTNNANWKHLFN
jgi:hypothetical protein